MTEFDKIREESGVKPSACSCKKCVNMCKTCPCLGTPQDILNLINNGYTDKLAPTLWAAGLIQGVPPIPMVQLRQSDSGRCIMLGSDDLCKLHDLNLKPTEGTLASCGMQQAYKLQIIEKRPPLSLIIAKLWTSKDNMKTVGLIVDALL